MGAECALRVVEPLHDLGDRDDRGIRGEDGFSGRVGFDVRKNRLLQRQFFRGRFENKRGVLDRIRCSVADFDPVQDLGNLAAVCTEGAQARRYARLGTGQDVFRRIGDRHMMTGTGKRKRDAMAHEPGSDDSDLVGLCQGSARRVAAIGIENMAGVEV